MGLYGINRRETYRQPPAGNPTAQPPASKDWKSAERSEEGHSLLF